MEVLLDQRWTLVPEQSRTNLIVPFTVPHAFEKLEFQFAYGPKVVDDPAVILRGVTEYWKNMSARRTVPLRSGSRTMTRR